jgi:hypothetical protein
MAKRANADGAIAPAIFRYLAQFHGDQQKGQRQAGQAFIPEVNEHLSGFVGINKDLAAFSSLG